MRLISTINKAIGFKAKIYFDSDYDEYIVKFYDGPDHLENADYFTSDRIDAFNTAKIELQRMIDYCVE